MKALIAEKPSVAKDIARILGANQKKDGYQEGNGYMVTWAFGHLITLAMPEEYGYKGYKREHLPMMPGEFKLVPGGKQTKTGYKADPGYLKQLKVIKEVFNQCDEIIVATDAGREGELIFRYIYDYLKCRKPFVRLWISSLTDASIKEGLRNLKPGKDYDNLYMSALGRSRADWLVGMNSSQALSISAGRGSYSLGRVQTPTLSMVCKRYLENKNFIPVPYFQLKADFTNQDHKLTVLSDEKWEDKEKLNEIFEKIRYKPDIAVVSVEKKEKTEEPPLLYDLTSLQKDANRIYNLSAADTLKILQDLYEKKFLTYPRTGSRYISEDIFDIIPSRIRLLRQYGPIASTAETLIGKSLNKKSVDASKVTDHHALIITENIPRELSKDEKAIYEMVASRMLEAFAAKCYKELTTIKLMVDDISFTLKGSAIKIAGWRAIKNEKEDSEEAALTGLTFREGQNLPLINIETVEKQTKPKPLHTEATLLAAMETAGKEIEDSELRASIKECGIGTPATRAQTIEKLLNVNYIERQKKNIVPTPKGLSVYETIKEKQISNAEMTARWETDLSKIEEGKMTLDEFIKEIGGYVVDSTEELLNTKIETMEENSLKCPKCKEGNIRFYDKVAKCTDPNCDFVIFRNKSGKNLTDKQIEELIEKGKTGVIKGFKSFNKGTEFDAHLVLDENYKVGFEFPERKDKK